MLAWIKKFSNRRKESNERHEVMFAKNEAHLQRERIALKYDIIRSLAK